MKRSIIILILLSLSNQAVASQCNEDYFPSSGGIYSPLEFPLDGIKSIVTKSINGNNIMNSWDEVKVSETGFVHTYYSLYAFKCKSIITGDIKNGRLSNIKQTIILDSKGDAEDPGESAKEILDTLIASKNNSTTSPINVKYDSENRITNIKFKYGSFFDSLDATIECKFLGKGKITQNTALNGNLSVETLNFNSKGELESREFSFGQQLETKFITSYLPMDKNRKIVSKTVNPRGDQSYSSMQFNEDGKMIYMGSEPPSSISGTFWTYDDHSNWISEQTKVDGKIENTIIRTITYK